MVEGVVAWDDGGDPSVCGIKIHSMGPEHQELVTDNNQFGWTVELRFEQGGVLGQPSMDSISVAIHLLDQVAPYRIQER